MSVYADGAMIVTVTSLPPFSKKPLLPLVKPAFCSTCSAAAVLPVVGMVADVTGPAQAWKVGSVSPPASEIGLARPASPSEASRVRSTARLIACRTASWLVGHLVRFGSRLSAPPAAPPELGWAGGGATEFFCRPG